MDTWTLTAPGAPWVDQQWGAQVILAAAYRLGGWTGLVLLRALLVGDHLRLRVRHRPPARAERADRRALLTLAAFVVSAVALALRPQLIGMALFAVVLLLVADRRAHPRRLWLVPVIVAVWANIHGSFFLGPVVLGLAWLEDVHDRDRRALAASLAVAVVSVAAACVNAVRPGRLGATRSACPRTRSSPSGSRSGSRRRCGRSRASSSSGRRWPSSS